mmetsp:Transcript_22360/g.31313  ORF Transcript_22360/g.31313 Transcript_22360/m.31313 type:complete len:318 (-) Transcript_22360:64-1017(-)
MANSTADSKREVLSISRLLSACIDCAKEAGKLIREIRARGDLGAKDKASGNVDGKMEIQDPVTVADIEAQRLIEFALLEAFPGLSVIGEEGKLEKPEKIFKANLSSLEGDNGFPPVFNAIPVEDVTIWIDPIDGTKSFILGKLDVVTCLIGVSVRGNATAGVVYYPWTKKLVWGLAGYGIRGDIPSLRKLPDRKRRRALVWFGEKEKLAPALKGVKGEILSITTSGSAANMILKVMQGEVDVYLQTANCKWDTCAVEAILRAAGGTLTDFYGKPYYYHKHVALRNSTGVVATMFDHESYLPHTGDEDFLKRNGQALK